MMSRSTATALGFGLRADVAQLVEHLHSKEGVRTTGLALQRSSGAAPVKTAHTSMAGGHEGRTGRSRPIPGVEIRERHPRGGGIRYSYRVRFQNARGERSGRTFDCAQDAMDFRARLCPRSIPMCDHFSGTGMNPA